MSEENGKVCCNCKHCIRIKDEHDFVKYNLCEVTERKLGYLDTMCGWCRRWARETK